MSCGDPDWLTGNTNMGWICPKCSQSNAPFVTQCPCPAQTWTGTSVHIGPSTTYLKQCGKCYWWHQDGEPCITDGLVLCSQCGYWHDPVAQCMPTGY